MNRAMNTANLAAAIDGFDGAASVRVRPLPRRPLRAGEIEVRVAASSVNPIDVRRAAGYGRSLFRLMKAAPSGAPLVLGNDFAGTVSAVGSGVTAFREGDAVFGAKPPSADGTHAAYVALDARHAAHQPGGVPAAALAALPYNYLTVVRALAGAGITSANAPATARGRRVLVHGASGGLGLLAVWLLKSMDAHVTAVAGAQAQTCLTVGADEAIDCRGAGLLPLLDRPSFDVTLNFANWDDDATLLRLLAPRALGHATTVHPLLDTLDSCGLAPGAIAALRIKRRQRALAPSSARYAWTVFRPDAAALHRLAEHAAALSALLPEGEEYMLSDAVLAYRHVAQRQPGRAILLPAHA